LHRGNGGRVRRDGHHERRSLEQPLAGSALRGIYAIVDAAVSPHPERAAAAIVRGGVRLVQYRAKAGVDRDLVRRLHQVTRAAGALLIVNDDLEAALDADGLHVGQEDLRVLGDGWRARLGPRILGISCGVPSEVPAALALGAAYLGVGPFAATGSKADAGPAIGRAGIGSVVAAAGGVPVAAIGGIRHAQLAEVAKAGARMAAVLSALACGDGTEAAARALVARWAALDA
jgi:thiamine-phosphate pyrophosphorylase